MYTYQDFIAERDRLAAIHRAISQHRASDAYRIALAADAYDRQENLTINDAVRYIYNSLGVAVPDPTASNNRIASNFFHRLNTQRVSYSLGNGVTFTQKRQDVVNGRTVTVDVTKEKLGNDFDTQLFRIAYAAQIHGSSYALLNYDSAGGYTLHLFPLTEFVPLLDEADGSLRAGIRFWSLDWARKPVTAVVYEEDGYTRYQTKPGAYGLDLMETAPKRAYKQIVQRTEADGDEVIGEENYSAGLPVVPMYGPGKQSTLTGMRASIDSYDLIQSGFANDLTDCAQIYWLIGGALGMSDSDLAKFRERLLYQHIGLADMENSTVTPYTQDIPYAARQAYLQHIRSGIYEAFGALDVTNVSSAARTATEIDAAYQPMDEEADAFEYRVITFVRRVLELMGIDDVPQFKRSRITNQLEQVQMVMLEADHLDDETVLQKLPNVTVDEVADILARRDAQDNSRFEDGP